VVTGRFLPSFDIDLKIWLICLASGTQDWIPLIVSDFEIFNGAMPAIQSDTKAMILDI
jgi:hypothetical protein